MRKSRVMSRVEGCCCACGTSLLQRREGVVETVPLPVQTHQAETPLGPLGRDSLYRGGACSADLYQHPFVHQLLATAILVIWHDHGAPITIHWLRRRS